MTILKYRGVEYRFYPYTVRHVTGDYEQWCLEILDRQYTQCGSAEDAEDLARLLIDRSKAEQGGAQ